MATQRITGLLKKTTHHDKDERFMATSDLIAELEKGDGLLDKSLQQAVRNAVLKQLEDSSTDVQTVAVKSLSTLVKKFNPDEVLSIVAKLGTLVVDPSKGESRDIYSIGLKTIIQALSDQHAEAIALKLTDCLIEGLAQTNNKGREGEEVEEVSLELIRDLLQRFGRFLHSKYDALLNALMPRLEKPSENIRKKATAALGSLVVVVSDQQFQAVMGMVVRQMEARSAAQASNHPILFSYIQLLGVICQSAGPRIAKFLGTIVPKLQAFCVIKQGAEANERMVELWENSLQAFQSIIVRCPKEMSSHLPGIIKIALQFLQYDPNYTYDDNNTKVAFSAPSIKTTKKKKVVNDEDDWGEDEDEDWDQDTVAMDDVDDDDSWKVRRAAVRCLQSLVATRPDLLPEYYNTLLDALVDRFKDRDWNVKVAVLGATGELLRQSVLCKPSSSSIQAPVVLTRKPAHAYVSQKASLILNKAERELSAGNVEIKKAVLVLLRDLLAIRAAKSEECVSVLLPHLSQCVQIDDVALKTESLTLIALLVDCHPKQQASPVFGATAKIVLSLFNESYLKLRALATRVAQVIVESMPSTLDGGSGFVGELYQAIFSQLHLKDMDQEVKEASLGAVAAMLAKFAATPLLKDKVKDCVLVIIKNLSNELTRLSALRALTNIAGGQSAVDFAPYMGAALPELTSFMRKESQQLKHDTAITLRALVNASSPLGGQAYTDIIKAATAHIGETDLVLCDFCLSLIGSALARNRAVDAQTANAVLDRVLPFLRSPFLQASSGGSAVVVFQNLVQVQSTGAAAAGTAGPSKSLSQPGLIKVLIGNVDSKLAMQNFLAVAQCIAGVCVSGGPQSCNQAVASFLQQIQAPNSPAHEKQLLLLVVGELGRSQDLSQHAKIEDIIFAAFSHPSDGVTSAASHALGNITVGNMKKYLPLLLSMVHSQESKRYLLLGSLKEVIVRHCASPALIQAFQPHIDKITPILLDNSTNPDEGVRSMVAECFGGLALMQGDKIVPLLLKALGSPSPLARSLVVASVRFAMGPHSDSKALREALPAFLKALHDVDPGVRRQAILTANAIANSHIDVMLPLLSQVLPAILSETKIDSKLVRVVDLGPFKHTIDDGLAVRKAAYQALDTVLDVAPEAVDIALLASHMKVGFADQEDIQTSCYQMLAKLSTVRPDGLAPVLDTLPDTIMNGIKVQLKEAKNSEPEKEKDVARAKDLLRMAVQCLWVVSAMPGIEACPQYRLLFARVCETKLLKDMLKEITSQ